MMFEIRNTSSDTFVGVYRTVIDPQYIKSGDRGIIPINGEKRRWAAGRVLSKNSRIFDIDLRLTAGGRVIIDTDDLFATPWVPDPLPKNPTSFFKFLRINNVPMQQIGNVEVDGMHFVGHYGARVSPMLYCKVHMHWCPGQSFAFGSLSTYCSNPDFTDMSSPLNITMEFGEGIFNLAGPAIYMYTPDRIGDGQVRHMPFGVHFEKSDESRHAAWCIARKDIIGHGVTRVGYMDKADQARFDPVTWVNRHLEVMRDNITDGYALPPIGIAPNSTVTGDQETEGYMQGFESLYPGGIGAERPRYFSGLGHGRYPCHYLNADGSLMMPEQRPTVMMWQGRPLWISKNSPQPSWFALGKERQLDIWGDASGWFGPDRQHVFINDVASSYELTGDYALADELMHSARNYLWEDTIDPTLTTSSPDEARSIGWRGFQVAWFDCLLPGISPEMHKRVMQRWDERVKGPYSLIYKGKKFWTRFPAEGGFHMTGFSTAVFLYQQAVAAGGLFAAYLRTGDKATLDLALEAAEPVVDFGYQTDGRFEMMECEIIGMNSETDHANWHIKPYEPGVDVVRTGWFRFSWLTLALGVVATSSSRDNLKRKAIAIQGALINQYRQMFSNDNFPADWFIPILGS